MSPPSATDPLLPNTNANNANTQPSSPEQPKLARRNMDRNIYWTLGCVYGASAVALGAFGAHGLKKRISEPQRIANFGTAAQYQLIHSAALLLASSAAPDNRLAANLFTAGMTMFSGSLYLLVLNPAQFRFLGPVTPLGGLCLIGGWAALAWP